MNYVYKTNQVCSNIISLEINENVVSEVLFLGGCDGNLKAIAKLVDGMTVEEIEKNFLGLKCKAKSTSCAEQLAFAAREAFNNKK